MHGDLNPSVPNGVRNANPSAATARLDLLDTYLRGLLLRLRRKLYFPSGRRLGTEFFGNKNIYLFVDLFEILFDYSSLPEIDQGANHSTIAFMVEFT